MKKLTHIFIKNSTVQVKHIQIANKSKANMGQDSNGLNSIKNKFASLLVVLALPGCIANDHTMVDPGAINTQEAAIQELRQEIIEAKRKCANRSSDLEMRNFIRTICENKEMRKVIANRLDQADLEEFERFFAYRIKIADKIDTGEITYAESDVLIRKAQQNLLETLKQK